jgi:predicted TIM-barrel fold metal-dependent hydrolase
MMEPHKGADMSWFMRPAVWQAATELGVPVCVHFFAWNREEGLAALMSLLPQFPDTDVIVDHFTNMDVFAGAPDHGVDALVEQLAGFPRVRLKFTTLPLGLLDEKGVDAAPVVERVVASFGADRVSWGSDIAQSKGSYAYMVELGRRAVARLSADDQRKVLHDVAARLYGGARP